MNDTAQNWLIGTGGAGALLVFLRWAVTLWATIRREELEAAKINAAAQRADGGRMVDALLAQARSNAELGGAIERSNAVLGVRLDALSAKLEAIEWRERTPVEGYTAANLGRETPSEKRQRLANEQRGYRPPRPGGQDDT